LPNSLIGTIGDSGQDMPIESMTLSADGNWLATTAHDSIIKIWDASIDKMDNDVFETSSDDDEKSPQSPLKGRADRSDQDDSDSDSDSSGESKRRHVSKKTKKSFLERDNSFYADLD
ncbi:hypothetical protein HDU91_004058, partial [Kappamyces sp. JEL0680]